MDFIRREELKELMQKRGDFCVSVFLPTHRAGKEVEQDPIRLGNLLRRAEKELVEGGMRSVEAREMLKPAYDLAADGFFTRHQTDGLGMFASPGDFHYFRVPLHFQELLAVGRRFHLKPLIPAISAGNRFYVLAASRKSVRLLQCTEFGVSEVELEGVPKSMEEALGYEGPGSKLFRSTPTSVGKDSMLVHGHGGGAEFEKEYLRNYFQKLKDSLRPYLHNEKAPLVFAGVEYLFPIAKQVNLYQNILEEAIEGNPDMADPRWLQQRGLEIVRSYFLRELEQALRRYRELAGEGLSSDNLERILPGAFEGRIDTLLVDTEVQKWGKYDVNSGRTEVREEPQKGDEDLLDLVTVETFLNGGVVHALNPLESSAKGPVLAIFRY